MCGSFYELLRRVCIRENDSQMSLPPIFDLRAFLQRDFESLPSEICMDLVKRLPLRVMNSSLSSTLFWLDQQGLQRPSEETLQILESIDVHTHFFASCLLPSLRLDYCPTDKDAPFRLFEMWEFEVMRNILDGLMCRGMISSAIWLHDGVWISPSPDPSTIVMLEASILRKLGLHCDQPFIRSVPFWLKPSGSSRIGSSCVTIYHCSVGQSLLVCKLRLCVSFGSLCIARVVPVRLV